MFKKCPQHNLFGIWILLQYITFKRQHVNDLDVRKSRTFQEGSCKTGHYSITDKRIEY
uniref:Uncharacterized protein n=1 Tax=Arundo donax TaxID=35708 RepID=A0A0A9CKK2_ARUDO